MEYERRIEEELRESFHILPGGVFIDIEMHRTKYMPFEAARCKMGIDFTETACNVCKIDKEKQM